MFTVWGDAKLCTVSHSHQQCVRFIFPHPHQHLLFIVCLLYFNYLSEKMYLIVVLICVSLMTNDVKQLSMFLVAICTSLEKCLIKSFTHLKVGLIVFLLLSCKRTLYILDICPLTDTWFGCVFSHSGLFFDLLMVPFDSQTFLILMKFNSSIFPFVVCTSGVISKETTIA